MASRGVVSAPHARLQGFRTCNPLRTSLSALGQLHSRTEPRLRDIGPCRAQDVAWGTPAISVSEAAARGKANLEMMAALDSKYYAMMAKNLCAPGEKLQLFTPYRPLTVADGDPNGDKILAQLMDGRPEYALVVTRDREPAAAPAAGPARAPSLVPEAVTNQHLSAGYYVVYGNMLGQLQIPTSADKWREILQSEKDGDTNEYKKFLMWYKKANEAANNKLPMSSALKGYIQGLKYGGTKGFQVLAEYAKNEKNMVCNALDNFQTFDDGPVDYTKYYNTSYKAVMDRVLNAGGFKISDTFNGDKTDNRKTWAEGRVRGAAGFFSAQSESSYDGATEAILKSSMEVTVSIDHFTTVLVNRSQGSWFYLPALLETRRPERKAIFDDESLYNENYSITEPVGNLLYGTSELIVASGITTTLKITSDTIISNEQTIRKAASAGCWPFFKAESVNTVTRDSTGKSLTITQTSGMPDQAYVIGRKIYNVFDL